MSSGEPSQPPGRTRNPFLKAWRRRLHRGGHRAADAPSRRRFVLTAVALAVAFLGLGGGAVTYQLAASPAPAVTPGTATPPDDLADRAADRADRDARPQPRRTGRVSPPQSAVKSAPPSPSPTRSAPPSPKPKPKPTPKWVVPTSGYDVSSGFGQRWGTMHNGVDLATSTGTPVVAAHSGTVELAEWYGGYGNAVIIDHGDGVKTLYGHNSQLLVSAGQKIDTGDRIALVGSTGDSTGPHLHFEVHISDDPVDPVPWMRERGAEI